MKKKLRRFGKIFSPERVARRTDRRQNFFTTKPGVPDLFFLAGAASRFSFRDYLCRNNLTPDMSRSLFFFVSLFVLISGFQPAAFATAFDRASFYAAFRSQDTVAIDAQLAQLDKNQLNGKDAFLGALLMRKGGLVKNFLDRLAAFKKGKLLLEKAIAADSTNGEYRFLRLAVQEHAPAFLRYRSSLQQDAAVIRKSFRKFLPELQQEIKNYARTSDVLKPGDFTD